MAKRKLFIDLGHFAKVPGASGIKSEIEWTRLIGARIEEQIDKSYWDVIWVPTDYLLVSDNNTNIRKRCEWIRTRALPDDVLISIHANAFTDPKARGVETYYAAGKSTTELMRKAAVRMTQLYNKYTGVPIRQTGAFPDSSSQHPRLGILQDTIPHALLVETGFCTNEDDMRVDPFLAAKAIAMYANTINPLYQDPMPTPAPTPDEELAQKIKLLKGLGVIKSELGMDNLMPKREAVLMCGRLWEKVVELVNSIK